jgi:hypothetical protein
MLISCLAFISMSRPTRFEIDSMQLKSSWMFFSEAEEMPPFDNQDLEYPPNSSVQTCDFCWSSSEEVIMIGFFRLYSSSLFLFWA